MTPADLIPIVRTDYLDDYSDSVDGDDTDLVFKDAWILRQIGEAQRQACNRQDLRHLFDDTTAEICTIPIVAAQQSYVLDSRILRLHSVLLAAPPAEDVLLTHVTQSWLENWTFNWREATGAPLRFFVTGRTLTLDHSPTTGTLYLSVWREPLSTPNMHDDLEWTKDPEKLGHWVAHRAFLRPDIGKDRLALSKTHRELFDQAFGAEVPAQARAELLAYPDPNFHPRRASNRWRISQLTDTCWE